MRRLSKRVISQGGKIDVPYKIATIFKMGNTILASNDRAEFELAEYSTKEKALKAMEMLRRAYENNMFYHCMANTKRFEEAQNILSVEQFQKATTEYFQFPQDDEIEV